MIKTFFSTIFYEPLYNGLVFLLGTLTWADAGIVVIILTLLVKLVLYPLSKKSVITQLKMRKIEPEIAKIRDKYKNDKPEQAKQVMELYKEKGVNPFSGILLILIQLPIIISLYYIFLRSGLPEINSNLLYSFISLPNGVNMEFLGLIDISQNHIPLAILVGITSFIQINLSLPKAKPKEKNSSFKDDLARNMSVQMRYVFPFIIFFVAATLSAVIALYFLTSNIFTIGQELYIKKVVLKKQENT